MSSANLRARDARRRQRRIRSRPPARARARFAARRMGTDARASAEIERRSETTTRKDKPPRSLAERRGEDWGLRDAAHGSVGVTRPIRVECYADRLVVISDRNPADNKVISLGPRTVSSIDPFISAVWGQIEAWGIAGRGMYWRPVLQVSVAPDAEERFADLPRCWTAAADGERK